MHWMHVVELLVPTSQFAWSTLRFVAALDSTLPPPFYPRLALLWRPLWRHWMHWMHVVGLLVPTSQFAGSTLCFAAALDSTLPPPFWPRHWQLFWMWQQRFATMFLNHWHFSFRPLPFLFSIEPLGCVLMSTRGHRHWNPLTPLPSPTPLVAPTRRCVVVRYPSLC